MRLCLMARRGGVRLASFSVSVDGVGPLERHASARQTMPRHTNDPPRVDAKKAVNAPEEVRGSRATALCSARQPETPVRPQPSAGRLDPLC